ncbi:unnamed protein product [Dovyalis caffra]|uniref:Uncharacterized protein n=1 Tax=Dovyalis caffra TaxID=77055 RepID=A0AAV1RJK7_9ROSI|nr:unnamed protein product [Dovyalis caffra]
MFQAFQANDESSINKSGPVQRVVNDFGANGNVAPKLVKLNFLYYNENEDLTLLISRVEQIFDYQNTTPEE